MVFKLPPTLWHSLLRNGKATMYIKKSSNTNFLRVGELVTVKSQGPARNCRVEKIGESAKKSDMLELEVVLESRE